ncbi:hypothetical protein HPP92_005800 [Vanilla planifolia]|uniref:Uncharacterized protein n=1 Tax=Vanilla planifolia TaxID=51239 RepID=A0A835RUQ4_VANPL|nr:hypothetical protein HPP92_005800 [Vanilla planifolia]
MAPQGNTTARRWAKRCPESRRARVRVSSEGGQPTYANGKIPNAKREGGGVSSPCTPPSNPNFLIPME